MFYEKIIGVIHAKGSSERVKRKNYCLLDGVPLFLCQAVNLSKIIGRDNVFIDSEDNEVLALARINGFRTFKRDEKLSNNSTGGVALLVNFLKKVSLNSEPITVVQLFPPMPILDSKSLKVGIETVHNKRTHNSAFFIGSARNYLWDNDGPIYSKLGEEIPNGIDLKEINFEFPTAYVVNIKEFLRTNSRVCSPFYKLKAQNQIFELDIDNEIDFQIASSVLSIPEIKESFDFFGEVRVSYPPIIFWDVDGTLTDGWYNSSSEKELFKSFHTFDGIALQKISEQGTLNCLVSASFSNSIIEQRAKLLKVESLSAVKDKLKICQKFSEERGFNLRECYFVGNDVNDLRIMNHVGRSFCPKDSDKTVIKQAEVLDVSSSQGGIAKALFEKLTSEKALKRV